MFLVATCVAAFGQARVHYVRAGASGAGVSWADATGDLAGALRAARSGDEVWVAQGTYRPTACAPCALPDRKIAFELLPGVRLRGGFAGTETRADERAAFSPEHTVLSGRLVPGVDSLDSESVIVASAPTPGTLLEGFTVAHGRSVDSSGARGGRAVAGALLFVSAPRAGDSIALAVTDCVFRDGVASGYGGAVFVLAHDGRHSEVDFLRCAFRQNFGGSGGGGVGISCADGGTDASSFRFCRFRENVCDLEGGGAVYWNGGAGGRVTGTVDSCVFVGNEANRGSGGALRAYGNAGTCSPVLTRVDFRDNHARFGGALEIDGSYGGRADVSVADGHFAGNESTFAGGAVYVDATERGAAHPRFARCTFVDNLANESGGGLFFNALGGTSLPVVRDCRIERNRSVLYGGGIYALGRLGRCDPTVVNTLIAGNRGYSAGGMYCLGSEYGQCNPLIVNSAFVNNRAIIGGALYSNANDTTGTAEPRVYNTIFQGNYAGTGHTLRNVHGEPRLIDCSFDRADCASLSSGVGPQQRCLGNTIFGTPDVFVDTAAGDYRLRAGAPVIDLGGDSILLALGVYRDLVQRPRFRGALPDLGPREFAGDPLAVDLQVTPAAASVCPGDDLTLVARVRTVYPEASGAWGFGGSPLVDGDTLRLRDLRAGGAGTYTYTLRVADTALNRSVVVEVSDMIATAVSIDRAGLPDTLRIGDRYVLRALPTPANLVDSITWLSADGTLLGRGDSLAVEPVVVGALGIRVAAYFGGLCLDSASRSVSASLIVAERPPVGLLAESRALNLSIHGNPVAGRLTLSGLPPARVAYEVYDALGRLAGAGTIPAGGQVLEFAYLTPGRYLLTVTHDRSVYRATFVKL